jgi:hypothetical protein
MKFKKGDKVVCVRDSDNGSFFGHPGETFTVDWCYEHDVTFEEMPVGEPAVDENRFELAKEKYNSMAEGFESLAKALESNGYDNQFFELEELVKIANEGLKAEHELLTKYFGKVQRRHSDKIAEFEWVNFTHNPYNGYSVYRVKPESSFTSFYVGEKTCCYYDPKTGYGAGHTGPCNTGDKLVKLEGDILFIGIYSFNYKELYNALADLTRDSVEVATVSGHRLGCMRNGICIDGKTQISWSDAERILEALEKAGI